jgi:putative hemolysin
MELLILLLLILLNGVFSMSEIALVSARKNRLEADAQRGDTRAKVALQLANDPSRFLSTVQIGITLIGVLTGIYSGENITTDLQTVIERIPALAPYAHSLAVACVVISITFFTLVLGELVPKRIGLTMPEPIAKLMALPMRAVSIITAPFIWLLTAVSDALLRILRIKPKPGGGVTEEEIRAMVQEGTEGGAVAEIEQDIVERVFTLGDRKVSSLMTYRRDVRVLRAGDDAADIRRMLREEVHGFFPVVEDTLDDVIGVVPLQKLLQHMDSPDLDLRTLMEPPVFVHEDMTAYKALAQFKASGQGYALVADELGATSGVVTISDILQALVGDVSDFHRDEYQLVLRPDGTWLVDGHYPLHDLLVRLDRSGLVRDVDADTVAGLVLHRTGHIPVVGERTTWGGMAIEVADMDGARIDKLIVDVDPQRMR